MPPLSILIKPVSGACNCRCRYCFYDDVSRKRENASLGTMSLITLENVVQKSMSKATHECTLVFQGGEPTLAGLDFYENLVSLVNKHNTKRLKINYALQTNGIVIDRQWARFFAENKFLVGLSLDGTKDVHDNCRIDSQLNGTFTQVMRAAKIFESCKTEYNILVTVTSAVAKNIGKIYGFFKRNNFVYQQYIPCLDPLGEAPGARDYSLTPEIYGQFLCALFDLWYNDIIRGKNISIRFFDNLLLMLKGRPPECCGMSGKCMYQTVIEADGGVYPCDFYVLDEFCHGNLNTDDFESIDARRRDSGFVEESIKLAEQCRTRRCQWIPICRGGCRRNYEGASGNYFCESFKMFFDYTYERLNRLAAML